MRPDHRNTHVECIVFSIESNVAGDTCANKGGLIMSKDAELLTAIGLGPDVYPSNWEDATDEEDQYCMISMTFRYVGPELGLDIPESEWTVEHDAAFARWVWPWFRTQNSKTAGAILNAAGRDSISRRGSAKKVAAMIEDKQKIQAMLCVFFDAHPGPVLCRAIHAVLCEGKSE